MAWRGLKQDLRGYWTERVLLRICVEEREGMRSDIRRFCLCTCARDASKQDDECHDEEVGGGAMKASFRRMSRVKEE